MIDITFRAARRRVVAAAIALLLAPVPVLGAPAQDGVEDVPGVAQARRSTLTYAETWDRHLQAMIAETLQWYLADEGRRRELDDEMLPMIDLLCRQLCSSEVDPGIDRLVRAAVLIRSEGIDAPLASLAIALSGVMLGNEELPITSEYTAAVDGLRKGGAPPRLLYAAVARTMTRILTRADQTGLRAYAELRLQLVRDRLSKPPTDPMERLVLMDNVCNTFDRLPADLAGELAKFVESHETMDPVLRHVILGDYERNIAWGERGSGFASTVEPGQWPRFEARLRASSEHFHRAWEADPSCSFVAAQLVGLAMAGGTPGGETPLFWFNRAVTATPDDLDAYEALAWAARPRWGGSTDAMLELAFHAADSGHLGSSTAHQFLKLITEVIEERASAVETLQDPEVARRVTAVTRAALDGGVPRPHPRELTTWRVVTAWANGRFGDALDILRRPGARLDRALLAELALDARSIELDAWARGGPFGDRVAAADEAMRHGRFTAAIETLEPLQREVPGDASPLLAEALTDRLARAKLRQHMASSDDWVALPFDPSLPTWRPLRGAWWRDRSGNVRSTNVEAPCWLVSTVSPGRRFCAQLDFGDLRLPSSCGAGFHYRFRPHPAGSASVTVTYRPVSGRIELGVDNSDDRTISIEAPEPQRGAMRRLAILVWDEWLSVSFMGKTVWTGHVPVGRRSGVDGMLAIGTSNWLGRNGEVSFERVEIKRLSVIPPEILAAQKAGSKVTPEARRRAAP